MHGAPGQGAGPAKLIINTCRPGTLTRQEHATLRLMWASGLHEWSYNVVPSRRLHCCEYGHSSAYETNPARTGFIRMYSHFSERLSSFRRTWSKNPDCHLNSRFETMALNAFTHDPAVVSDVAEMVTIKWA